MSKPKPLTKQQRQYVRDQLVVLIAEEKSPVYPQFYTQGNFTICVLIDQDTASVKGAGAAKCHPINHRRIERTEERGFDTSHTLNGDEYDPARGEEIALGHALLESLSDECIRELVKNGAVKLQVPKKSKT